jgi:hypothetical protein
MRCGEVLVTVPGVLVIVGLCVKPISCNALQEGRKLVCVPWTWVHVRKVGEHPLGADAGRSSLGRKGLQRGLGQGLNMALPAELTEPGR